MICIMKNWCINETDRHILVYCSSKDKQVLLLHLGKNLDTLVSDHGTNAIVIYKDGRWEESDTASLVKLIKEIVGEP